MPALPAFRSAGAWTFSPNSVANPTTLATVAPAGVQPGDLLVLITESRSNTATCSTPTGWTAAGSIGSATASGGSIFVFTRIADGSATDTPSVTWTGVTTGTTGDASGAGILAYTGALTAFDPTFTVGDLAAQTTTTTTLGVTTTLPNTLVIAVAVKLNESSGQTASVSGSGFTERVDAQTTSGTGHIIEVCDKVQTSAGASGTTTVTWSITTSARGILYSAGFKAAPTIIEDDYPYPGSPGGMTAIRSAATAIALATTFAVQQGILNNGAGDFVPPPAPAMEEYSWPIAAVSARPDHVSTTFPLPWSWDVGADDITTPPEGPPPGGSVTRDITAVTYRYSGTSEQLPAPPDSSGGGGSVSREISGVVYRYSGTSEDLPSAAPPTSGGGGGGSPPGGYVVVPVVRQQYSGTSEQLPVPPTPIIDEADVVIVQSRPDHISTTFPLPWSWETEDQLPSGTAATVVTEDYQWPLPSLAGWTNGQRNPAGIVQPTDGDFVSGAALDGDGGGTQVGPPTTAWSALWSRPRSLSATSGETGDTDIVSPPAAMPLDGDGGQGTQIGPLWWSSWNRLDRRWEHGANTIERPVPPAPVTFEEDSWWLNPFLTPRPNANWWTPSRYALWLATGIDQAESPPIYVPPPIDVGGIKVVDIRRQIASVDSAPSRSSVDLPLSAERGSSVDLEGPITAVDIEN